MHQRLTYAQSCARLRQLGVLAIDEPVPMRARTPGHDDEEPFGVSFFRTFLGPEDGEGKFDLSNLTLPRTFFGRSEIRSTSFENSDLSESNLCWNDFIDVSFAESDLSRCDMRASIFKHVSFNDAILDGADLRQSSFEACSFDRTSFSRSILNPEQGGALGLSQDQREQVAWTNETGPEPPGG